MAISTSRTKSIKDRNRSVTYEGIDDEIKRDRQTEKAAGRTRSFTRGKAGRAR